MTAVLLHPRYKSLLLTASADGVVRVWSTDAPGKPLLELRGYHTAAVNALTAFGKQYASVGDDGRLVAVDVKSK